MKFEVVKPRFEIIVPPGDNPREYFNGLLNIIEIGGRNCYKTEERIKDSESRNKFIKSIISRGHLSVIEHATITVRFVGSRSMSHQLVRHRIAAISQESQRYCNYSKGRFGDLQVIRPLSISKIDNDNVFTSDDVEQNQALEWIYSVQKAVEIYELLIEGGVSPEDARSVLPNACKTDVIITMNMRTWRHFFNMRCDKHAQWEIRALACGLMISFKELIPVIFDDFKLKGSKENDWKLDSWLGYPENHWGDSDYTKGKILATDVDQIPQLVERRSD